MKASEVLRKAGDVLRRRGWCQRQLENAAGNCCMEGAIRVASTGSAVGGLDWDAWEIAWSSIPDLDVVVWNDMPGRTAEEVHAALDAAYVLALQEEGEDPSDYEEL